MSSLITGSENNMGNTSNNGLASATKNAQKSSTKPAGEILIVRPNTTGVEIPKVEAPKAETVTIDTREAVTLLSQREKNEKLTLLFEREEKLSSTKKALDRFKLATDESTNELELRDGKGAQFRTSNPTLIKVVLKDIAEELQAKQKLIADDIIAVG